MLSSINIVKQKAIYDKICDFKTNGSLYFPREDINGTMYVVSQSGEVFYFNEGASEQLYNMNNGQPSCICFDAHGTFYITELSNGAIYYKSHCKDLLYYLNSK